MHLTVEVLEVGKLYPLPHGQQIDGRAEAVESHPEITGIQRGDSFCSLTCGVAEAGQSMLDVGPSSNDRTEDHQTEREERHRCHGSAKPEHFTIRDQNDCKILEDGVDRDGEELERFCARVNHADQEDRNGKP